MQGEAVGVEQGGRWVPATVLWEDDGGGRRQALVRFDSPTGGVVRRLCWYDELLRGVQVLELQAQLSR